jgi:hypothetical protein
MKRHDKVEVLPNTFIISTPDDAESSVSCPGHFNPVERVPPLPTGEEWMAPMV